MYTFRCKRCDAVDSSITISPEHRHLYICHECTYGVWHNQFPKETFVKGKHDVINPPDQDELGAPSFG